MQLLANKMSRRWFWHGTHDMHTRISILTVFSTRSSLFVIGLVILCFCVLFGSCLVVNASTVNFERPVPKMTYYVRIFMVGKNIDYMYIQYIYTHIHTHVTYGFPIILWVEWDVKLYSLTQLMYVAGLGLEAKDGEHIFWSDTCAYQLWTCTLLVCEYTPFILTSQ